MQGPFGVCAKGHSTRPVDSTESNCSRRASANWYIDQKRRLVRALRKTLVDSAVRASARRVVFLGLKRNYLSMLEKQRSFYSAARFRRRGLMRKALRGWRGRARRRLRLKEAEQLAKGFYCESLLTKSLKGLFLNRRERNWQRESLRVAEAFSGFRVKSRCFELLKRHRETSQIDRSLEQRVLEFGRRTRVQWVSERMREFRERAVRASLKVQLIRGSREDRLRRRIWEKWARWGQLERFRRDEIVVRVQSKRRKNVFTAFKETILGFREAVRANTRGVLGLVAALRPLEGSFAQNDQLGKFLVFKAWRVGSESTRSKLEACRHKSNQKALNKCVAKWRASARIRKWSHRCRVSRTKNALRRWQHKMEKRQNLRLKSEQLRKNGEKKLRKKFWDKFKKNSQFRSKGSILRELARKHVLSRFHARFRDNYSRRVQTKRRRNRLEQITREIRKNKRNSIFRVFKKHTKLRIESKKARLQKRRRLKALVMRKYFGKIIDSVLQKKTRRVNFWKIKNQKQRSIKKQIWLQWRVRLARQTKLQRIWLNVRFEARTRVLGDCFGAFQKNWAKRVQKRRERWARTLEIERHSKRIYMDKLLRRSRQRHALRTLRNATHCASTRASWHWIVYYSRRVCALESRLRQVKSLSLRRLFFTKIRTKNLRIHQLEIVFLEVRKRRIGLSKGLVLEGLRSAVRRKHELHDQALTLRKSHNIKQRVSIRN